MVIRVRVTVPLLAVAVVMAAALLTGCAIAPTLNKPTGHDHAVRGPSSVDVSGVLLVTGGVVATNGPTATPVSGGIVTFRLETDLGSSSVSVRTAKDGEFHIHLQPGVYRVEAAFSTYPDTLSGSFGPFRIHSGHNVPLKLTLAAM